MWPRLNPTARTGARRLADKFHQVGAYEKDDDIALRHTSPPRGRADMITVATLQEQERLFASAFAAGDIEPARSLYHADVVYISPTVRLFDWPARIEGVDRTLAFIALTIRGLQDISYDAVEQVISQEGDRAFVRIHFDWTHAQRRLRSSYVVIYRYRDGRIGQQELYYDPSGRLEDLTA